MSVQTLLNSTGWHLARSYLWQCFVCGDNPIKYLDIIDGSEIRNKYISHPALFVGHQEDSHISTGLDPGHDLAVVLSGDVHAVDLNDDVSLLQACLSCRRKFLYTTYKGRILIKDVNIHTYILFLDYGEDLILFRKIIIIPIPFFLTYQLYGIQSPCCF